MELDSPRRSVPAVLAIVDDEHWPLVGALLRDLGVLGDRVTGRDDGLAAFLRRGGHEGVLCVGADEAAAAEMLAALREVDPALPCWRLPAGAEPSAEGLRELFTGTLL